MLRFLAAAEDEVLRFLAATACYVSSWQRRAEPPRGGGVLRYLAAAG